MSRGPGSQQRAILDAITADPNSLIPLCGATRSERAALTRAAMKLQTAGKCVVVRIWNDARTALQTCVANPLATIDGKPASELNVARVTRVTGATFKDSLRDIAQNEKVSHVQVWRDIRQQRGIPRSR